MAEDEKQAEKDVSEQSDEHAEDENLVEKDVSEQLSELKEENEPILIKTEELNETVPEIIDDSLKTVEITDQQPELQEELSPEELEALLTEEDSEEKSPNEVEIKQQDDDDIVQVVSVKELTEKTFKRNTIEAALLAAQRPIGIEEISIKLGMPKAEIQKLIQEIAEDYMDRQTSIEIVQIGEGFAMQIKPEYTEKIVKFASGGLIPKAVMRTLTIIAVKQPLLKSLLVKMRGSTAYEHCKFLIDRGYVTAYKKGRSSILETTDQFADTFGLSRNVESLKAQLIEQLDIQSIEEPDESGEPIIQDEQSEMISDQDSQLGQVELSIENTIVESQSVEDSTPESEHEPEVESESEIEPEPEE